jgi:DNA-binding response OmpR family regulator
VSGKILIVDDSLTVREDLLEALAAAGLSALACGSGAEARTALSRESIGLVILDVLLPDADGVDLLREFRAMPGRSALAVLMLSTEADVRDRIRGLAMGSNDYVGKPYDRDYVVTRARQLLRGDTDSQTGPSATVLVIDDSTTFRELLCETLREHGYTVLSAVSGEEGLRSIAANRPAAVIVDGMLPGIDGATVVRKVRMDVALRNTPCILLTGSGDQGAELRALDSGADAFVRKEEDIGMILARVAAVLRSAGGSVSERETPSLSGPKKILAVDDSPTYLEALAATLREEGYDVIMAQSGEEALDMLAAQPMDCILLDRLMPGLGGTQTCRRIKTTPTVRDTPLIMLTAMEDRDAMIEGLSTGADDYVLKSSEFDVLKARVRAQLRRKQFEDEGRHIRAVLMTKEIEAAEARAARELAESRAELLSVLEQKSRDLEIANSALRERQIEIAQKNLELENANRAKDSFLSSMSHELRTPLNSVIGFTGTVLLKLPGPLNEAQEKQLRNVERSAKHLLALINDLLDLARIGAGKMEVQVESLSCQDVLEHVVASLAPQAEAKRLRLLLSMPTQSLIIHTDRRLLTQIVLNLANNAIKFTQHGSVRLQLGMRETSAEKTVEIAVSDTGVGIRPEDQAKLFESFVQVDEPHHGKQEGSGLGLHLSRKLAELLGGTISLSSQYGEGSTFTLSLTEGS